MKDDNLGRDEKKHVAKNGTQGRYIGDTQWKTCISRIRRNIGGYLYAKLEHVNKMMGKVFEKFLEQQKFT